MYRSRVAFDTSSLCRSERRKRGKSFDKVTEERLGREILSLLSRRICPSARCRYAAFGTVHRVPVVHALPIRSSSSSFNSPLMSTNPHEDRTSETQNGSLRLSSLFRCSRLSLFEAIKRLAVRQPDYYRAIDPIQIER